MDMAHCSPQEAYEAVQAGRVHLLDVREEDEWHEARIAGALHLPASGLRERLGEVPRDRPVVVACSAGSRSQLVTRFLRAQGIDARNLVHGLLGWQHAGLPLDTAPPRSG